MILFCLDASVKCIGKVKEIDVRCRSQTGRKVGTIDEMSFLGQTGPIGSLDAQGRDVAGRVQPGLPRGAQLRVTFERREVEDARRRFHR